MRHSHSIMIHTNGHARAFVYRYGEDGFQVAADGSEQPEELTAQQGAAILAILNGGWDNLERDPVTVEAVARFVEATVKGKTAERIVARIRGLVKEPDETSPQ